MNILLISYDNNSYIHHFPLGLAYVASKLIREGHDVEIYNQDIYHYPEAHLAQYLRSYQYDAVGVGMCAGYYQYKKFKAIRDAVPLDIEFWLGGHMVSPIPDYFQEKFGVKPFVGEYDYTEDVDNIPYPAWHLFPIDYYTLFRFPHATNSDRCFTVLSGRGCPFHCNFCFRMYEGYRPRSIKSIVDEIKILQKDHQVNYIDFADELLMINPDRGREVAEALKSLHIKWMCNGRLNYANLKALQAMKESGCQFINYGIESVDDEVLRNMNKRLTVEQIISGIENTLSVGISPGFNIIWGNIGDTRETLAKSVDFLLKYDDHSQLRTIRPVTPYPGCDLYYYAIGKGLLKDCADFYENKHINSDLLSVNFTKLSDVEFHKALFSANKILLENYYQHLSNSMVKVAEKLYFQNNINFRGFRQT